MDIPQLLKAKARMERLVADAVYEFELATDFATRVNAVQIIHSAPTGTKQELIAVRADVSVGPAFSHYPED